MKRLKYTLMVCLLSLLILLLIMSCKSRIKEDELHEKCSQGNTIQTISISSDLQPEFQTYPTQESSTSESFNISSLYGIWQISRIVKTGKVSAITNPDSYIGKSIEYQSDFVACDGTEFRVVAYNIRRYQSCEDTYEFIITHGYLEPEDLGIIDMPIYEVSSVVETSLDSSNYRASDCPLIIGLVIYIDSETIILGIDGVYFEAKTKG